MGKEVRRETNVYGKVNNERQYDELTNGISHKSFDNIN